MISTLSWITLFIAFHGVFAHEPLSLDNARALIKRNEHANHKCRRALEARNTDVYHTILQKRDAYGFLFDNDTSYTPQGFNTSMCALSEEQEVGPYVPPTIRFGADEVCAGGYTTIGCHGGAKRVSFVP
jgi:hypothetical protein